MKYFLKNDKGMFGITYGEDIHCQMRMEDLDHVPITYDHLLKARIEKQ